jgi:hypothetical protein
MQSSDLQNQPKQSDTTLGASDRKTDDFRFGTKQTSSDVRLESAMGNKADVCPRLWFMGSRPGKKLLDDPIPGPCAKLL